MRILPVVMGGKVIGEVRGTVYVTYRHFQHFFRKYKGFGISDAVLREIGKRGVDKIRIVYKGLGGRIRIYESTLRMWLMVSETYVFRDSGQEDVQRILPVRKMKIVRDNLQQDDPLVIFLEED